MKQKIVLGKGIASLIPSLGEKTDFTKARLVTIPVSEIRPAKNQPRTKFSNESLNELAQSIKTRGILQPIVVRRENSNYEIVAGERRYRAAKLAGLESVPAIINEYSDLESLEASLIENVQREDINPIDAAQAYDKLIREFNLTQEDISVKIGKDRATIANCLRLLKLPEEVRRLISDGKISEGHGRALLPLPAEKMQISLAHRIIREKLSVRVTEDLVSGLLGIRDRIPTKRRMQGKPSANLEFFTDKLKTTLGTKVAITSTKKGGKIIIDYYSHEDLERLIENICKKRTLLQEDIDV